MINHVQREQLRVNERHVIGLYVQGDMQLRERMNYCISCLKQDTKLGSVEVTNGTGLVFKAKIITHIIHDFSIFCFSSGLCLL